MKYAVMIETEFNKGTDRDKVAEAIKLLIIGKKLWFNDRNPVMMGTGVSDSGKASAHALLRFEDKGERDEVGLFMEDMIARIPALNGRVEYHRCYHDQPELNRPCEVEDI